MQEILLEKKHENSDIFINFDKNMKCFYLNLYIEEFKLVVRMLLCQNNGIVDKECMKCEKFNLSNRVFLLSLENSVLKEKSKI